MRATDKKRWGDLHEALAKVRAEQEALESKLRLKYGMNYQTSWLSNADQTRLEKFRAKADKIGDKIIDMIVRLSPRGEKWLRGVPSWWLREKLTWEDMLRPEGEELSVVVPGARGYPDGFMKEQTMAEYQGWANWATWNVALWFGNDEGLYRAAVREAQSRDGFDADGAEEFVLELLPDGTPDFNGDPSKYDEVNWQEIADDFNEMAGLEDDDEEEEDDEEEPGDPEQYEDDEDEDDVFSDAEMQQGFVISDGKRGGYDVVNEHRHFGHFREMDDALEAIEEAMKRDNFYANIYYVNDHGNIDLLDSEGNSIKSRV